MSYDKPQVCQSFQLEIVPGDRDADGKLTPNAVEFLRKVMPDTVHRLAPHVPAGKPIRITIVVEGNLA